MSNDQNYKLFQIKNLIFLPLGANGTHNGIVEPYHPPNISEMLRHIARYNDMQVVLNEDQFGSLQNDSVIIVVQVSKNPILQALFFLLFYLL